MVHVLLWSSFPVLAVLSAGKADVLSIAFYAQVFGAIVCVPMARSRAGLREILADLFRHPVMIFIGAMASLFLHIFFMWSVKVVSSLSALITFELWPVFSLIFAALFVRKKWSGLGVGLVISAALGTLGVTLLVIAESEITAPLSAIEGGRETGEVQASIGIGLAFLASVLTGLTVIQTEVYRRISPSISFSGASYTILLCRLISIPVIFGICQVYDADLLNRDAALWGLLFGVSSYSIGSILTIEGVRYSKNIANILIWYFTPLISALWLSWLAGVSIYDIHVLAFMPVLLANILASAWGVDRFSVVAMNVVTLVAGGYIYMVPVRVSTHFFEAIGVMIAFYAIVVSFVLQRKIQDVRAIALEIHSTVASLRAEGWGASRVVSELEARVFSHGALGGDMGSDRAVAQIEAAAERVRIERATSASFGDTVSLGILTAAIVIICSSFRDGTFVGDVVAITVIVVTAFMTLYTLETSAARFQWRLATSIYQGDFERLQRESSRVVVSVAGVAILYGLFIFLLVDKYEADVLQNWF